LILLNELPVDCRKNISFFLKLQETESSFAEWFGVIILNLYFSFMQLPHNKKIYFASDQHFGAPTPELSF
jgi:hypothetical protein